MNSQSCGAGAQRLDFLLEIRDMTAAEDDHLFALPEKNMRITKESSELSWPLFQQNHPGFSC